MWGDYTIKTNSDLKGTPVLCKKTILKVKDNVDLKQLEGLNFYYDDNTGQYKSKDISFTINVWNRRIKWNSNGLDAGLILFDLIQKDFVEKVEVTE